MITEMTAKSKKEKKSEDKDQPWASLILHGWAACYARPFHIDAASARYMIPTTNSTQSIK